MFLLISFGGAWGWHATAHLVCGWSLVNPLVQLPAAFAPAVAALVVRRWVTGESFADAGSSLRLRAMWRYYLLAWLGPLGVVGAVVGLAAATGHSVGVTSAIVPGIPTWGAVALLCVVALATTIIFWGEEFGWTGYLVLRICPGRPRLATVTAGLIAAVWHYPLAFLGYAEFDHAAIGLALWSAWIICQEIVLAWLRAASGSIWPACLAHAGTNMVLVPITSALLLDRGDLSEEGRHLLIVLVMTAAAAVPFLQAEREVNGSPS